ncbi:MAG: protein serine/threonine phosphatase [Bacteroidetes bacterium]|nr:protein serine/threonine phosphatase [Bacteroidota bacterium]
MISLASKLKDKHSLANSLNNIALGYFNKDLYSDAINYLERAYNLSIEINDSENQSRALLYLGRSYYELGKYPEAMKFLREQMKLVPVIKDQKDVVTLYNTLAAIYYDQGNLTLAHEYYMKEVKLAEMHDMKTYMAQGYNNLAIVYDAQKKYDKALEYYLKDLKITEQLGDEEDLSLTYNNIGDIYLSMKEYEKARVNIEKAIEIAERLNYKYGLSVFYNSLGTYYEGVGNKEKALEYYKKDMEWAKKMGNKFNLAISYHALGDFYVGMKRLNEAEEAYLTSLSLGLELKAPDPISTANKGLAKVYELKGDFQKAYKYHVLYKIYYDSLFTLESEKTVAELNTRYESDKMEKTIELLNKEQELKNNEIKKQKLIRYSFTIGFILMLILAFFVFKSYRIKQKANELLASQKHEIELKNNLLQESKNDLQKQKDLVDEKQKEILDSINYAKRIQYTLLAHEDFLKKHLTEHFVIYKPKDIVSGDFYWATEAERSSLQSAEKQKEDGNIRSVSSSFFYLAVCDSTGHGVPGAFMSLLNIGFLSEAIKEKNIVKPNEIFNYTRKRLIENVSKEEQKDGFDGLLLCIDKENKKITYASANTAALLVKDHEIIELKTDKMPVGIGEKQGDFNMFELQYHEGDLLYIYTDGYVDQFGGPKARLNGFSFGQGKKFKSKQLNELILESSNQSLVNQKNILIQKFEEWKGDLEQVDDVLLIAIKL